mmetsp:Transcript_86072/g.240667  ORF Transcript_86072/g.240667 Transcript_86072/m.240667 type:complete len:246 (-) Transcript_86072:273-1010(-)
MARDCGHRPERTRRPVGFRRKALPCTQPALTLGCTLGIQRASSDFWLAVCCQIRASPYPWPSRMPSYSSRSQPWPATRRQASGRCPPGPQGSQPKLTSPRRSCAWKEKCLFSSRGPVPQSARTRASHPLRRPCRRRQCRRASAARQYLWTGVARRLSAGTASRRGKVCRRAQHPHSSVLGDSGRCQSFSTPILQLGLPVAVGRPRSEQPFSSAQAQRFSMSASGNRRRRCTSKTSPRRWRGRIHR